MLGSKLRSWMEAVRPRKKQQRKEKQAKSNLANPNGMVVPISESVQSARSSENEMLDDRKVIQTITSRAPCYSGANLSSPESAYSTGYSTDGTSPGAPPEYYINIRTGTRYLASTTLESKKYQSSKGNHVTLCSKDRPSSPKVSSPRGHHLSSRDEHHLSTVVVNLNNQDSPFSLSQEYEKHKNPPSHSGVTPHNNLHPSNGVASRLTEVVVNSGITSPRQRNRIRTNPWLPGNNLSPGNSCVGLHARQDLSKIIINSPIPTRYISPAVTRNSINRTIIRQESSSSSCSSLSTGSINWDQSLLRQSPKINSGSDDEDCTLNEMMGKYDESYVYEKETDILSDSDPTDCETDIDTGQDGGDEDDPLERDLDYIDNGSYLEFNIDNKDTRNTGCCTYYNYESHKRVSRRRTRRSQKQDVQNQQTATPKQISEKRRRSTSSRRKFKGTSHGNKPCQQLFNYQQIDGSRSAGATPLSVRRTKHPLSKLAAEEQLRRRSSSVSFSSDRTKVIDQRDKEADRKYKELIVEAEHILMSMKTNGLSPRRLPGPPNKRVELLRNAESTRPESFIKNRLIDETGNLYLSKIPSNNFNLPRFSPKKNHITNFINNNSPVLMRRDIEVRNSPLACRKELQSCLKVTPNSPLVRNKHITPKTDLPDKRSLKYRKKINKTLNPKHNYRDKLRSDSDEDSRSTRYPGMNDFCCPQSEPVKRKVYFDTSKKLCFLEFSNNGYTSPKQDERKPSSEDIRQQVLLNTIVNLKRSLEDQSASLRQVYKSSQNVNAVPC